MPCDSNLCFLTNLCVLNNIKKLLTKKIYCTLKQIKIVLVFKIFWINECKSSFKWLRPLNSYMHVRLKDSNETLKTCAQEGWDCPDQQSWDNDYKMIIVVNTILKK